MSFSVYYLSGLTDLIPDCSFRGISQPENIALTPPTASKLPLKNSGITEGSFALARMLCHGPYFICLSMTELVN